MRRSTGVLVLVLLSCPVGGGGGEVTGSCGEPVDEQLDPAWINHIVPGTPEPTYLTDPPTSGPHFAELPQTGVLEEPLSRPSQVSVLESGAPSSSTGRTTSTGRRWQPWSGWPATTWWWRPTRTCRSR